MLDEDEAVSVAGLVARSRSPVDPAPALLMELESRPLSAVSAICCSIRMTTRRVNLTGGNAGRSDAKKTFSFSFLSLPKLPFLVWSMVSSLSFWGRWQMNKLIVGKER